MSFFKKFFYLSNFFLTLNLLVYPTKIPNVNQEYKKKLKIAFKKTKIAMKARKAYLIVKKAGKNVSDSWSEAWNATGVATNCALDAKIVAERSSLRAAWITAEEFSKKNWHLKLTEQDWDNSWQKLLENEIIQKHLKFFPHFKAVIFLKFFMLHCSENQLDAELIEAKNIINSFATIRSSFRTIKNSFVIFAFVVLGGAWWNC